MKTRKESTDSGGKATTVSSEWVPFHEQNAGDAGNTGFMVEEETPNGETPTDFTSTSGELPQGKTQSEFTCGRSFMGLSLEDLYIIEICAGSARLSKAAHESGFKTMAVDHTTSRSSGFPICVFDLTDPQDLASILRFVVMKHQIASWGYGLHLHVEHAAEPEKNAYRSWNQLE